MLELSAVINVGAKLAGPMEHLSVSIRPHRNELTLQQKVLNAGAKSTRLIVTAVELPITTAVGCNC
jgi:hypothetical protein